jgi:hypothetical protein
MEYSPYSSGEINLVKIIVPTAIIVVDMVCPMNSWKPPAADTFPIFNALSMGFLVPFRFWDVVSFRKDCEIR